MIQENTSFHRQFPIQLKLDKEIAVFYFSAGFTGKINQDTGMIVSLPTVDQKMKQLIAEAQEMQFSDEFHFLNDAFLELGKAFNVFEVRLQSETKIFSSKMGVLQSLQRFNLSVQFPNEEKFFWIFSEKPPKKKLKTAGLKELLGLISVDCVSFILVDPLTQQKYISDL